MSMWTVAHHGVVVIIDKEGEEGGDGYVMWSGSCIEWASGSLSRHKCIVPKEQEDRVVQKQGPAEVSPVLEPLLLQG